MPSTVNGVGTRYRNERNVKSRPGTCQRCKRSGNLTSYDVEEWFVFFYIPLFKVKTLHVISYCPHCTGHVPIKKDEWEKRRTEGVSAALARYRENPRDGAAAVGLLEAADFFEDPETFKSSFEQIREELSDDPDVLMYMARLALQQGDEAEAESVYKRVLEIDEYNFKAHVMLMLISIDRDETAVAEEHARAVTDGGASNHAHQLIPMVQHFQEKGDHGKALDMLERIEALLPEIGQEKDFLRLRGLSEANQGSGKAVKGKPFEFGRAERERKKRNLAIAVVVVVLGVIGVYLGYCAVLGAREPLWIVNGTNEDYSVKIDGESFVLPAYETLMQPVGLGTHTIESHGGKSSLPPTEFSMEKGLFLRPFSKRSFVSNPDEMGVVMAVTFYYGSNQSNTREPAAWMMAGQPFMALDDIDHPFEDPPDSISSSSSSSTSSRTVLLAGSLETLMRHGVEKMNRAERIEIARKRLALAENPNQLLTFIEIAFPPEDVVTLLQERYPAEFDGILDQEVYYGAVAAAGMSEDVVADLNGLLANNPSDPELLVARGLLETDPELSLDYLKRAADCSDASDEIKGRYAESLIRHGQPEEGIAVIESLATLPETCAATYYRALIDRGRIADLQEIVAGHDPGFANDISGMLEASLTEAGSEIIDMEKLPKTEYFEEYVEPWIEGNRLYAEGRVGEAVAALAKSPWSRFDSAVLLGNLEEAMYVRNYSYEGAGYDDLILYLIALDRKDAMIANTERQNAIRYLRRVLPGGPVLADMIEGSRTANAQEALDLELGQRTKILGLLMLAKLHPELADDLYPEIRKLNRWHTFPAREVSQMIGEE